MKYNVVKNLISDELCMLLATEMKVLRSRSLISGDTSEEKITEGDGQVKNSFGCYGSLGNESLMLLLNQKANQIFDEPLDPTYTYARIYKTGAVMDNHIDRPECSHSVSICLEKDKYNTPYPLYMEDEPIELEVGDAIFYKGEEVYHRRDAYKGDEHIQVFVHYTPKDSGLIYDGRPFVNLPKNKINE